MFTGIFISSNITRYIVWVYAGQANKSYSDVIQCKKLLLSHIFSRQTSIIDTGGIMLMLFFPFHSRVNGREREVNGILKQRKKRKRKTIWHPTFFFSCMSNADMERGGGECWGNRRRRIHRRLNLLLSSAVIEQNKDRTQYRILTPQHSRNQWNHYTSCFKRRIKEGWGRGAGRRTVQ